MKINSERQYHFAFFHNYIRKYVLSLKNTLIGKKASLNSISTYFKENVNLHVHVCVFFLIEKY